MLFPLYDHNPHHRIPWVTGLLILANVAVMLWLTSLDQQDKSVAMIRHGFVPQRLTQLDNGQPVSVEFDLEPGLFQPNVPVRRVKVVLPPQPLDVYQSILTMMFLHGGWLHLVSNMWMLWVFGNNIEDRLGHLMFVLYYVLGGIIATMAHWTVEPNSDMPVIGASGAVAAVLGGYAVTYPNAKIRTLVFVGMIFLMDLPALLVLGVWFAIEMVQGLGLIQGFNQAPIAFWAHIGGFVAGMILIPILGLGTSGEEDWKSETESLFRFDDIERR
jgi:membrane associated rhomboid family serine protease